MIEAILELIVSVVFEWILALIGEVLFEFGFHSTAERLSAKSTNRILIGTAYAIFGALLGFLSLLVFPKISFVNPAIPLLYFVVSPVVAGFSLTIVSWLINRGIRAASWFEYEKFIFGVVFALGYSVSRFAFG